MRTMVSELSSGACCELGVVRVSSEVGTREIPTARHFPRDAVVQA